jgi:hypothetical protein
MLPQWRSQYWAVLFCKDKKIDCEAFLTVSTNQEWMENEVPDCMLEKYLSDLCQEVTIESVWRESISSNLPNGV